MTRCHGARTPLWIFCTLLIASSLSACGDSSSDRDRIETEASGGVLRDDVAAEPLVAMGESPIVDADDATRRFETLLSTPFADADSHESWMCLDAGVATEYRLLIDEDGSRRGEAVATSGEIDTFTWMATAVDAVLFSFDESGRTLELSSLRFDGDDAFRAYVDSETTLECRRQIYQNGKPTRDTTNAMPIEVDRETAEALQLAERLTTRYADARNYDYWFCVIENSEPIAYLFVSAGLLGESVRALTLAGGVPVELPDDAPIVGWTTSDGATVILTPEDADGLPRGGVDDVVALRAVVFPLDGAFTATRQDGATLQCLLQSWSNGS